MKLLFVSLIVGSAVATACGGEVKVGELSSSDAASSETTTNQGACFPSASSGCPEGWAATPVDACGGRDGISCTRASFEGGIPSQYLPDENTACGKVGGQCGDYRNALQPCGQPGMSPLPNASGAPLLCNNAYETCCAPDRCSLVGPPTCKGGTTCVLSVPPSNGKADGLCLLKPTCDVNGLCASVSNTSVHMCIGKELVRGTPPTEFECGNIPDACVAGRTFPTCTCILREMNDPRASCTTDVNGWPVVALLNQF